MTEQVAEVTAPETGPIAPETSEATAQPEPQSQDVPSTEPEYQPDSGVAPEKLQSPEEPNNVDKVDSDGSLKNAIDGKVPEGLSTKEEWLHNILEKERANPETDFNEDELDILDEYYEGRLKPKEPTAKEEAKEADPDEKSEDEVEEGSIADVLKEVGAKSEKELLKKVKDLRKVVSGKVKGSKEFKDLQSQAKDIQTRFQNELALYEDVKAGNLEAINFMEKNYGIKIQRPGEEPKAKAKEVDEDVSIDEEYLDDLAGKKITALESKIQNLVERLENAEGQNNKIQEKFAGERAESQLIDEMMSVAEKVPVLSQIKNLRNSITAWRSGKEDPRLSGFEKVFKVANEKGIDLVSAYEILAGRSASIDIAKAKHKAKEEAYTQKPNRSLSELQGKGVENQPSYSDNQVVNMIEEGNIPENWYDSNDQPNAQVIPKKYHKYFFHATEMG